jgi:hypothetical protein
MGAPRLSHIRVSGKLCSIHSLKKEKEITKMEQKKRPTGVTILAILALIGGIFGIIAGIGLLGLGAMGAGAGVVGAGAEAIILGLISLVIGVGELVFAIGAWTLKPWAWTLGVIILGIGIVLAIIQGAIYGNWGSQVISIVINAILLYYLNTRSVKEAFGKA